MNLGTWYWREINKHLNFKDYYQNKIFWCYVAFQENYILAQTEFFKRHCTCIVESRLAESISGLWHVIPPAREGSHSCRLDGKLGMFRHLRVNIERITSSVVTDLWLLVLVDLGLLSRWDNLQKKQRPSLKLFVIQSLNSNIKQTLKTLVNDF